jgi:hypothetical protein
MSGSASFQSVRQLPALPASPWPFDLPPPFGRHLICPHFCGSDHISGQVERYDTDFAALSFA